MSSADLYIQRLLEGEPLREPLFRNVIKTLHLPLNSHGLDAGCGIGLQARLLAQTLGAQCKVIGLDLLFEHLSYGQKNIQSNGYAQNIHFCQGDVTQLPFADLSFDWIWSADCIGYPLGELAPFLRELRRVLKPGGRIILLGWSSQQLLPGYPILEARINATCSGYIPYLKGKNPELNFMRAARQLREAGLVEVKAQTFVGTVQAPLNPGERAALLSLFEMLWGEPQPEVSAEDWEEYQCLCTPGSPDFILDIPEYVAFFTISVFEGQAPGW
jgi:ubiquinone/menaquinone biosynthesis C-methylase UbiE